MIFSEKEKKDMIVLLSNIVQAKEEFCSYIRKNGYGCKTCPLGVDDKCFSLDLPEFNFNKNQWKEEIENLQIFVGARENDS